MRNNEPVDLDAAEKVLIYARMSPPLQMAHDWWVCLSESLIAELRVARGRIALQSEEEKRSLQMEIDLAKQRDAAWECIAELEAEARGRAEGAADTRRHGIYVASRVRHAQTWLDLRASGIPIIATWIDEAEEGQSADYAELSVRCLREATSARAVILYCQPGDILKGALVEIGAALSAGVPVFCVGECDTISRVFRKHPAWHDCEHLSAAVRAAIDAAEGGQL